MTLSEVERMGVENIGMTAGKLTAVIVAGCRPEGSGLDAPSLTGGPVNWNSITTRQVKIKRVRVRTKQRPRC